MSSIASTGLARLLVGASGWSPDGWEGRLYPADLPPEWRPAVYAAEFTAVRLSVRELPDEPEALDDLLAQLPSGFRLFISLDEGWLAETAAEPSSRRAHLLQLRHRLAALLLELPPSLAEGQLARYLEGWHGVAPLLVDCGPHPLPAAWQEPLRAQAAGHCWRGIGSFELPGPHWAVAALPPPDDLQTLRGQVEAILAAAAEQCEAALLFDGTPDPEWLRRADVLGGLVAATYAGRL